MSLLDKFSERLNKSIPNMDNVTGEIKAIETHLQKTCFKNIKKEYPDQNITLVFMKIKAESRARRLGASFEFKGEIITRPLIELPFDMRLYCQSLLDDFLNYVCEEIGV